MRRAIELARVTCLVKKAGGPFGCVIVKDGEVVAEGANTVLAENDPTCHGEMNAIRFACKKLETHDLSGCILYTTGEPCPMCYAASWWARIDTIYYASTIQDAKVFGDFDDVPIADAMKVEMKDRPLSGVQLLENEMLKLWEEFFEQNDRVHY